MSTTLKSPAASRWFAASAGALAIAMTMGLSTPAEAASCLLDTNNNGVADAGDTTGGSSTSGAADSLACGVGAQATINSTAVGGGAVANTVSSTAIGNAAATVGNSATTVGASSMAGTTGTALGMSANAILGNDVAIGANTVTDRANTVAVGNRQITQVAAGTVGTESTSIS